MVTREQCYQHNVPLCKGKHNLTNLGRSSADMSVIRNQRSCYVSHLVFRTQENCKPALCASPFSELQRCPKHVCVCKYRVSYYFYL